MLIRRNEGRHLTTDQTNSDFRASPANNLDVISALESDDAGQDARRRDVRGRLPNVAKLQLRLRCRGASDPDLRPSSPSTTRRTTPGAKACQSQTEQLFRSALEDVSRLNEILRTQQCTAIMRGIDGVILPLNTVPISPHGARSDVDAGIVDLPSASTVLSTPIFDTEGRHLASLEIIQGDAVRLGSCEQLLRALVESVTRAITERWFRLAHRRQWVVAAMRRNAPGTTVILAIDRDLRIVGADRQARQLIGERHQQVDRYLPVSALFRLNPTLLRRRSYCDISTTLFASGDGGPWIALITPPDAGAIESHQDARVLLHVRPRQDSLTHLSSLPLVGRTKRGLSPAALQRIEEYIEARLDSALDIDELAAILRMSSSHFTRSFHKSVGVTPHRYVIQNRVTRARELLTTTNLPLTEIALITGFSDQSHFSRRFHEIVGIPPGTFRGLAGRI
jgi:AraC-like DNA-binding protein/PAS domain-containing protein